MRPLLVLLVEVGPLGALLLGKRARHLHLVQLRLNRDHQQGAPQRQLSARPGREGRKGWLRLTSVVWMTRDGNTALCFGYVVQGGESELCTDALVEGRFRSTID